MSRLNLYHSAVAVGLAALLALVAARSASASDTSLVTSLALAMLGAALVWTVGSLVASIREARRCRNEVRALYARDGSEASEGAPAGSTLRRPPAVGPENSSERNDPAVLAVVVESMRKQVDELNELFHEEQARQTRFERVLEHMQRTTSAEVLEEGVKTSRSRTGRT
jgi:hypothetical protein